MQENKSGCFFLNTVYLYLVFVVGYKLRPSVPTNSLSVIIPGPYLKKKCLSAATRWGSFSPPPRSPSWG